MLGRYLIKEEDLTKLQLERDELQDKVRELEDKNLQLENELAEAHAKISDHRRVERKILDELKSSKAEQQYGSIPNLQKTLYRKLNDLINKVYNHD